MSDVWQWYNWYWQNLTENQNGMIPSLTTSTKAYVSLAQVFMAQTQLEQSWNTVDIFYKLSSNLKVVLLRRPYSKYKNL